MFLILFVLILLSFAYKIRRKQMTTFERLGIPGPKPNFIFGNAIDIAKYGTLKMFPKWAKKYGPVVGFFLGGMPQVLISDLDLIRQVLIKDFHLFVNRQLVIPGGIHPQTQMRNTVGWSRGDAWRQIRSKMEPSFTSSKADNMENLMMTSIVKIINKIDHELKDGHEINLKPIFEELTFSVGVTTLMGVSMDPSTYEKENLLKAAKVRLQNSVLAISMLLFPSLTFIAYPLRVWWESTRLKMMWSPEGVCFDISKRIIRYRKENKIETNDVLQSLLNIERDFLTTTNTMSTSSDDDMKKSSTKSLAPDLSEDDIAANSFLLLFAAYEATSTTLQFIILNLVNNPDVQNRLRSQLKDQVRLNDGVANLTAFAKVPLLMHVIKETLRMCPPGSPATSRIAEQDYELNGYRIPKGTGIFIGVASIHNDPQLWPEPEKFKPSRFEEVYNKMAYLPFGAGPRACIGMKFAYMELQLVLAHLVLKHRFEAGPSTNKGIETIETFTLSPKNGAFCKIVKI